MTEKPRPYFVNLRLLLLRPSNILTAGKPKRRRMKQLEIEIPVFDLERAEIMIDHFAEGIARAFQEAQTNVTGPEAEILPDRPAGASEAGTINPEVLGFGERSGAGVDADSGIGRSVDAPVPSDLQDVEDNPKKGEVT